MSIGFKPKGEVGPAYHPDRDYAYLTPTLMCAAIDRMEMAPTDELKEWKTQHNITPEEIATVAEALARAQQDFVNSADAVTSFEQALARRDWADVRYPVRQLLFAAIGEVFCAAWFTAVRDVSLVNEESPATAGMVDFAARVKQFVGASGQIVEAEKRVAALQFRNNILQSRVNTLGAQVDKLAKQLTAQSQPITVTPTSRPWWARILSWK